MVLDGLPHLPLLNAFEHDPSRQRHGVGYDANDHVEFQFPLSLCLAMIPRFAVSHVSLFPRTRIWLTRAGGTRETRGTAVEYWGSSRGFIGEQWQESLVMVAGNPGTSS